jgi:hypothetical protein
MDLFDTKGRRWIDARSVDGSRGTDVVKEGQWALNCCAPDIHWDKANAQFIVFSPTRLLCDEGFSIIDHGTASEMFGGKIDEHGGGGYEKI